MSFKLSNLKRLGNTVSIPISADDAGFLGRECPESTCEGYFKVTPGTGLTEKGLPCHCPYCGHTASNDHFWTKEQIEYAKSVAFRKFADAVHKDLKSLEFSHAPRGGLGIGMSLRVTEGTRPPIRYYREKAMETEVVCESCTLKYAIYGVFGYCPDCRTHNSLQILSKNHDLISKQLTLAATIDDDSLRRHLIEDALENCVSAFDGFGREACRVRASKSANPSKCEKISFQNLVDASARVKDLFAIEMTTFVSPLEWSTAHRGFMKRHLLAHRAGVVDARYLTETSDSVAVSGRRVPVEPSEVQELARITHAIGRSLITTLPAPP